jgi:RHS repeat-associated protein
VTIDGQPASVDASNNFRGTAQISAGTTTVTLAARDASGNQITQQYEVDASGSTSSYTYDANGNLTADGTKTYFWNALNQLVEVKEGPTTIATFEYDGKGRRTKKIAGGITRTYIYDAEDIVEERISGSSSDTIRYYHGAGIDEPLARKTSSDVVSYYLADHLGSIVQETSSSAAVTLEREHDAWGVAIQGGSNSGYAFTGREWDSEIGLSYHRARYYEPSAARWLTEDPIGFEGGINYYRYVNGTPTLATDSDGLQAVIRMLPSQQPSWMPDLIWTAVEPDPASDVMIVGPMAVVGPAAKPALSACKAALKKVHEIVGKMSKSPIPEENVSRINTPKRGDSITGYRGPEGPHKNAPPGSPEEGWHFNWWDFTEGHWNGGKGPGRKGSIPIK